MYFAPVGGVCTCACALGGVTCGLLLGLSGVDCSVVGGVVCGVLVDVVVGGA